MTTASISHDLYFPHAPERVWAALTSREALAQWLMPNDFAPGVGSQFTFQAPPMPAFNFDGVCHCEVTAYEPPRLLTYTWNGGELRSLVTYQLEPEGDGTRLRFEHSGFDLSDPIQLGAYQGMQGWRGALDVSLRQVIDAQAAVRD